MSDSTPAAPPRPADVSALDADGGRIVTDESGLLVTTLEALEHARRRVVRSYDQDLIELRDAIAEARLEDVPPLMQQMERVQLMAQRRSELPTGMVDVSNPYFGHLRLEENHRKRDVLIGNTTYVDTDRGVRIVDWRDAPVSRLYYRYAEGDEYEEEFGGRPIEGTVLIRRSLVISQSRLRRVISPQGTFVAKETADASVWRKLDSAAAKLSGGQGLASRPGMDEEYSISKGRLGVRIAGREDRHLPEIPALIDPRQFELISKPGSHLVVIQGGAGSGKTTIGLHRLAYLTFQEPRRFSTDRMIVVVFNEALASYITRVLPALGVPGVQVITFTEWASRQRKRHVARLNAAYADENLGVISRVKKHPAMLTIIDEHVADQEAAAGAEIARTVGAVPDGHRVTHAWESLAKVPLARRLSSMTQWIRGERAISGDTGADLARDTLFRIGRTLERLRARARDVVWDWAELVTDRSTLIEAFDRLAPGEFTHAEISLAVQHSSQMVSALGLDRHDDEPDEDDARSGAPRSSVASAKSGLLADEDERREVTDEVEGGERTIPRRRARGGSADDDDRNDDIDDDDDNPYRALDGVDEGASAPREIDREDDALILRLFQRKRGPLLRDKKTPLLYEHIFVDEAQDFSPVEMAVLLDCSTPARSITLAGDIAQRLLLDNGFTGWEDLLEELNLTAVAVEPLKIGYRSTKEVLDFAMGVLGPLAEGDPPLATRTGAPVEVHPFPDPGAAAAFLGEALRELSLAEPRASVAVIARDSDRADMYFKSLERSEVPRLRRVRKQDFAFKPGVEVTDIRQVKGLEFDYVVLVDVNLGVYPVDDESRHLLHIGATRAAHQLWVMTSGEPSRLLPPDATA